LAWYSIKRFAEVHIHNLKAIPVINSLLLSLQDMMEKGFLVGNRKSPLTSAYPHGRATLLFAEVPNCFYDIFSNAAFFTSVSGFIGEEDLLLIPVIKHLWKFVRC
jgi:hypothetical protein